MSKSFSVTWEQFKFTSSKPNEDFENLARLLFQHRYFPPNTNFHSNPNHPGIEIEPARSIENELISFQAKYFTGKTDYNQIKRSFEMAVANYDSSQLNKIYLYSNTIVSTNNQQFKKCLALLNEANILLEIVDDQEILNQVIYDSIVMNMYFGHSTIDIEWFEKINKRSRIALGNRYNSKFNVSTNTETNFHLFTNDQRSVDNINKKKSEVLDTLETQYTSSPLIVDIRQFLRTIEDIQIENITDCLQWETTIKDKFGNRIEELKEETEHLYQILYGEDNNLPKEEAAKKRRRYHKNNDFLQLVEKLYLSNYEKNLLQSQLSIIRGDAGFGKSQMLANYTVEFSKNNNISLLLLGNFIKTNNSILSQVMEYLDLTHNKLEGFLAQLEAVGQLEQTPVILLIDAINESDEMKNWEPFIHQLITKLPDYQHVKVAISIRTGYEKIVFNEFEHLINYSENVVLIDHNGFRDESIEATKIFLNEYNIPFYPSYYFRYEMQNPLFLTIFCNVHNNSELDLQSLFEQLIIKADKDSREAIGKHRIEGLLYDFIEEMISHFVYNDTTNISRKDLLSLPFWELNGIHGEKLNYISSLKDIGFLITFPYGKTEFYSFGYELLQDYLISKSIIDQFENNTECQRHILESVLKVSNKEITDRRNQVLIPMLCSLYAEKFGLELIEPILSRLEDEYIIHDIFKGYIQSYSWRKPSKINSEYFKKIINEYRIHPNEIFNVLIENSLKVDSPINTEFLHEMLMSYSISQRDYLWTIYINGQAFEESRLYQLIKLFFKGGSLEKISLKQTKLLLSLFTWVLTSSNRNIRDITSQSITELLKTNFDLCLSLLMDFKECNDPYVLQRLFGVIYGAVLKRNASYKEEFKTLTQYIYQQIFNVSEVYPDILLRDYARNIIERWLYEFGDNNFHIDSEIFRPPYRSKDIPKIENKEYLDSSNFNQGVTQIILSMDTQFGDFGKYEFSGVLREFEGVDTTNAYLYCMDYIMSELEYSNELFGKYDTQSRIYSDRHDTKKNERIGKKYQWIAYYNLLARVADNYPLNNQHYENRGHYNGPWNPYVRDYDPSLNINFLSDPNGKKEFIGTEYKTKFLPDLINTSDSKIEEWLNEIDGLFNLNHEKIIIEDSEGEEWILLQQSIENKERCESDAYPGAYGKNEQTIWRMIHGYFVNEEEFEQLHQSLIYKHFWGRWFPEGSSCYSVFNREYHWSSAYFDELFYEENHDGWIEYHEEGEEVEVYHDEEREEPYFEDTEEGFIIGTRIVQGWTEKYRKKYYRAKVLPAYIDFKWEEQYDASQKDATFFTVPCGQITTHLSLEQKEYDGYYYHGDELIAYDTSLNDTGNSLIIRLDYLQKFLKENKLRIFWVSLGEKRVVKNDSFYWSEWSGFLYLDNNEIKGNIKLDQSGKNNI